MTGLDVVARNHAYGLTEALPDPNFRYLWQGVQDIEPTDVAGQGVAANLGAQRDTPLDLESPRYTTMQNISGALDLLEEVRRAGVVSRVLFADRATRWAGRSRCPWTRAAR